MATMAATAMVEVAVVDAVAVTVVTIVVYCSRYIILLC